RRPAFVPLSASAPEPERPVDLPAPDDAAEPRAAPAELPDFPLPGLSSELAQSQSSGSGLPTEDLGRLIGDPLASLRQAGEGMPGLGVGPALVPHVSDCCGEPQPRPTSEPARDVYVYPDVVKMVRAEFPVQSQRRGEEGSVLLEMTVGADGLVKDVAIIESSGHPRIDDCAVDAA